MIWLLTTKNEEFLKPFLRSFSPMISFLQTYLSNKLRDSNGCNKWRKKTNFFDIVKDSKLNRFFSIKKGLLDISVKKEHLTRTPAHSITIWRMFFTIHFLGGPLILKLLNSTANSFQQKTIFKRNSSNERLHWIRYNKENVF